MTQMFPSEDLTTETVMHREVREYVIDSPQTEDVIFFNENEVKAIIDNLKKNKSPGWDQLNNEIIKHLFQILPELFVVLYNKCLQFGVFPKIWKISVIKILLKSIDKPKNDIKSYRPISSLCVLAKVLEKLIKNRINNHLYSNNLSDKQFGFSHEKSTEDAINHIISLAQEMINKKQFLLIILLDIKGAFDNTSWPQIFKNQRFLLS
jgi:hypothetical protein